MTVHRTLDVWTRIAATLDLNLIEMIVFNGVWTANTEHLNNSKARYARLRDLPPDRQRRPIGLASLAERLRLPEQLCRETVERLVDCGLAEQVSSGVIVPSAVFTQERMLQALTDGFEHVRDLGIGLSELRSSAPTTTAA
ncbi:MAG TPA: hypothetical protein VIO94_06100 [Phenylobacterium sp.]